MGFGSDVIEEKVSPCGDAFFCVSRAVVIVHEIYIGDFANISAILQIYQRNSKYIGDYSNISTFRPITTTIAKLIFSFIDG